MLAFEWRDAYVARVCNAGATFRALSALAFREHKDISCYTVYEYIWKYRTDAVERLAPKNDENGIKNDDDCDLLFRHDCIVQWLLDHVGCPWGERACYLV